MNNVFIETEDIDIRSIEDQIDSLLDDLPGDDYLSRYVRVKSRLRMVLWEVAHHAQEVRRGIKQAISR